MKDSDRLELDWLLKCKLDADCRNDGSEGRAWSADQLRRVLLAIRDLFPHVPPENDVLGRLLCFAMRVCLLRIEKNPNPTAH